MSDLRRVNGNQISWGSLKFKLAGQIYTGFTSLEYSDKLESVQSYGMGKAYAPRARTGGKYSADLVKVKGPIASVQALRADLAKLSPSGRSYGMIEFFGVAQFIEIEANITVELLRLKWQENNMATEESPDPTQETFGLSCMGIVRNGLVLFDDSQGSPLT